jgi:hypothetical protein
VIDDGSPRPNPADKVEVFDRMVRPRAMGAGDLAAASELYRGDRRGATIPAAHLGSPKHAAPAGLG